MGKNNKKKQNDTWIPADESNQSDKQPDLKSVGDEGQEAPATNAQPVKMETSSDNSIEKQATNAMERAFREAINNKELTPAFDMRELDKAMSELTVLTARLYKTALTARAQQVKGEIPLTKAQEMLLNRIINQREGLKFEIKQLTKVHIVSQQKVKKAEKKRTDLVDNDLDCL
jgi:hypothetical protein